MIFGKPNPSKDDQTTNNASAQAQPPAPAVASGTAAPASPAAASAAAPQAARIRYVDRIDIADTFADAVTGLVFDGQTLRVEFGVTRLDEVKPNEPITGRRYPTCRLVLPPTAAIDLINRMQQIAAALRQAGVVRSVPRPGETPPAA